MSSPNAALAAPAIAGERSRIPVPDVGVCGVNYAHNYQNGGLRGYGSSVSRASLDELKTLGIRSIALTTFAWMQNLRSASVRWDRNHPAGESFDRVRADAGYARSIGLDVILKPHIWIGRGAWRAELDPDPQQGGWDRFFATYSAFILAQAELAEEIGASMLVIGLELRSSVEARPEEWRRLINSVRQRYSGAVTYSANWDEVESVPFWNLLDAVSVQNFAPLATGASSDNETLEAGARRWLRRWTAVAEEHDLPLLLTEVGFMNRAGTVTEPHLWPERVPDHAGEEGLEEQQAAYRAVVATFGAADRVQGMWWWKWFTDPNTDEEGQVGFSPRNKPAAEVLRHACTGSRR